MVVNFIPKTWRRPTHYAPWNKKTSRIRYLGHLHFFRTVTLILSFVTWRCSIYFFVFARIIFNYFMLCAFAMVIFTYSCLFSCLRFTKILCLVHSFRSILYVVRFHFCDILCCVYFYILVYFRVCVLRLSYAICVCSSHFFTCAFFHFNVRVLRSFICVHLLWPFLHKFVTSMFTFVFAYDYYRLVTCPCRTQTIDAQL